MLSRRLLPQKRPRASTSAVAKPKGRLPSIAQNATLRLSSIADTSSALKWSIGTTIKSGRRRRLYRAEPGGAPSSFANGPFLKSEANAAAGPRPLSFPARGDAPGGRIAQRRLADPGPGARLCGGDDRGGGGEPPVGSLGPRHRR